MSSATQHENRHGETLVIRSHDVIQHWASERNATPATVEATGNGGKPGVLRFEFGDRSDSGLKRIDRDEWFTPFDEPDLVFVFQEHRADGSPSNFFHLDSPHREHPEPREPRRCRCVPLRTRLVRLLTRHETARARLVSTLPCAEHAKGLRTCFAPGLKDMEVDMAYRDYEFDRDYGNRGSWRGRGEYDRDRWYGGGYGAGGYGDWDRGWNRASYGGWGSGANYPDYNYGGNYGGNYGRGEPWYGGGYGNQGMERGYGNQNLERGYGGYERGYPGYGGYGYGGYTGYGGYGGYGGGYGNYADEWRDGSTLGYESGTSRYQGRQSQGNFGRQQNYSGRGPRNYQRSDDRIEEDVNEALTRHPWFDASDVEVRVQNGEVTLTGSVDSRQDKRMAEDAAESCPGVRDVHNQLRVSSAGSRGAEREVTRTPTQEGRTSGESRSGARQTASSRSSK